MKLVKKKKVSLFSSMTYDEFHSLIAMLDNAIKDNKYLVGKEVTINNPKTGEGVNIIVHGAGDYTIKFFDERRAQYAVGK